MIPRPLIKNHPTFHAYNNVVNLCKKFNNCLEDILAFTKNSHIIDPCGIFDDYDHFDNLGNLTSSDYDHFDNLGNLTSSGRTMFWKFIDSQMKRFDRKEIELLPAWKAASTISKKTGHNPRSKPSKFNRY